MVLKGNLAPDGALLKVAGLKRLKHPGSGARLRIRRCSVSRPSVVLAYAPGDVIVIRNEGPRGGPGMREMLGITAPDLWAREMGEKVALITDGRFSGATRGMCIGYVLSRSCV